MKTTFYLSLRRPGSILLWLVSSDILVLKIILVLVSVLVLLKLNILVLVLVTEISLLVSVYGSVCEFVCVCFTVAC